MKTYQVIVQVTGYETIVVMANNEDEAIRKASSGDDLESESNLDYDYNNAEVTELDDEVDEDIF